MEPSESPVLSGGKPGESFILSSVNGFFFPLNLVLRLKLAFEIYSIQQAIDQFIDAYLISRSTQDPRNRDWICPWCFGTRYP